MPVFSIEIDTDNLTCVKKVNGIEVDFDSIALSKYTYRDYSCCCDDDDEPEFVTSYDVSYEMKSSDGRGSIRESFYWDSKSNDIYRSSFTSMVSSAAAKLLEKLKIKK